MRTFDVYASRYNEWADKPYRGTVRTFYIADWTSAQMKDGVSLSDMSRKQPPIAQFDVGGPNTEDSQRELANKVCDYLNALELARSKVKVEL